MNATLHFARAGAVAVSTLYRLRARHGLNVEPIDAAGAGADVTAGVCAFRDPRPRRFGQP